MRLKFKGPKTLSVYFYPMARAHFDNWRNNMLSIIDNPDFLKCYVRGYWKRTDYET